MNYRIRKTVLMNAFCCMGIYAAPAMAAPEETQVYLDEINQAGETGLDVHVNYVADGDRTRDYPDQQLSLHRWRITPEFSYGLGSGFEAGLYLPLATIGAQQALSVDGIKARMKWLAPHGPTGFYWGANLEVGRVAHTLDINPWNSELKLIGGWRDGPWQIGVNGNFDFVVSGPQHDPISAEITTKVSYKVTNALRLGLESYNGLGALRNSGPLHEQEQATFLTVDTKLGKWDVNAGIGRGYGSNPDKTIVKFVIGVPLGPE